MAFDFDIVGHNLYLFAFVFGTVLTSLSILACYICRIIKESDRKQKYYLINLAKRKGMQLDMEKLKPSILPLSHEELNDIACPMAVPNIGIFVS